MKALAPIAAAALLAGCAPGGPMPGMPETGIEPGAAEALAFRRHVDAFYTRLMLRRFNTLDTFNDPVLREHFHTLDLFFDYYAALAQALAEARFERSRPMAFEIQHVVFQSERQAFVQVRFRGADGRPLRPGRTHLLRVDRWERAEGTWWLTPEKL